MTPRHKRFFQDTIVLVYDFDGTLSPQPMQEYSVLPTVGVNSSDFWAEVNQQSKKLGEEPMLTYMRLLCEKAEKRKYILGEMSSSNLARM